MNNLHRRDMVIGLTSAAALGAFPAFGQGTAGGTQMAQAPSQAKKTRKKIGLIGGLALRAGIFYYEQLLQRYNTRGEPLQLFLRHADVKQVLASLVANDRAELGRYLGALSNEMADAGADLVAVTAVAPHVAIKEISHVSRVPVVNVLDTLAAGLKTAGFDRVAVFGNRVVHANIFGALRDDMVVKLEQPVIDEIHTMYGDIALNGKRGTRVETERLSKLAHDLMQKQGAQAIVLAGTDLSSFYAEQKPDYPFLDMAQLHIDQIMSLTAA